MLVITEFVITEFVIIEFHCIYVSGLSKRVNVIQSALPCTVRSFAIHTVMAVMAIDTILLNIAIYYL